MTDIRRFSTPTGRAALVAGTAMVAGASGLLSTVPVFPPLQGVLLLVFMLTGPGCAAMCWTTLPPAVTIAAVVGLSVATVLATSVAMAWVPFWGPIPSCLALSAASIASGAVRWRALRRPVREGVLPW